MWLWGPRLFFLCKKAVLSGYGCVAVIDMIDALAQAGQKIILCYITVKTAAAMVVEAIQDLTAPYSSTDT